MARRLAGRRPSRTLVCAAVATVAALVMVSSFTVPGYELDEGYDLAYPTRVLAGDLPFRDFESYNGPAGWYVTAVGFTAAGPRLGVERAIGVAYRVLAVVAIALLAVRLGLAVTLVVGLAAAVFLAMQLPFASPFAGGFAAALAGLAVVGGDAGPGRRRSLAAGGLLGLALWFRFDFGIGVLPAVAFTTFTLEPRHRRAFLGSFAAVVGALIVFLLLIGPSAVLTTLRDIPRFAPGRRLPIPGLGSQLGRAFAATVAVPVFALVAGALLVWRGGWRWSRSRPLVTTALFAGGLVPYAAGRADDYHLGEVMPATAAVLALAVAAVVVHAVGDGRARRVAATAAALAVAGLALITPMWSAGKSAARRIAQGTTGESAVVASGERSFRVVSPATAAAAETIVGSVPLLDPPHRTLFVGPTDLRRTNYNDTYLYYLLPDMTPASRYLELSPGVANRAGSGLAEALRRADVVILDADDDFFAEPNASSDFGSPAPNRVLKRLFCLRAQVSPFSLLQRCRG